MKLTDAEIEYTRQVAAEIGADPEALIAEGERLKAAGYQRAYEVSADILGGGRSNQMISSRGGPAMEAVAGIPGPEAQPELEIGW
jgi:hypothetical protein